MAPDELHRQVPLMLLSWGSRYCSHLLSGRTLCPGNLLHIVGPLAGEQVVSTDALADLRPGASPTAQEGPAHHGEDAAGPADKHRLAKLDAARESTV